MRICWNRLFYGYWRNRFPIRPSRQFISANVIHIHFTWKQALVDRSAAIKVSAECQVQDHVEVLVKRCRISIIRRLVFTYAIPVVLGLKKNAVNIPPDFPGFPFYGIGVEVRCRPVVWKRIFLAGIHVIRCFPAIVESTDTYFR
ncbi:hypothetical protein D3C76_1340300 [compost metagenome]